MGFLAYLFVQEQECRGQRANSPRILDVSVFQEQGTNGQAPNL